MPKGPQSISIGGVPGTIETAIKWVPDKAPTAYDTFADYKRVTVTVKRSSDSKVLSQQETYVGPATTSSYGGTTLTRWSLKVQDLLNPDPIPGATVRVDSGPSSPQSDQTDASGTVVFPALQPGNYSASVDPPDPYANFTDDVSDSATPVSSPKGTQSGPTVSRVYLPGSITVSLLNANGTTPFTGSTTVTLSYTPPNSTKRQQAFGYNGSPITIDEVNGEKLIPLGNTMPYKMTVSGGGFSARLRPTSRLRGRIRPRGRPTSRLRTHRRPRGPRSR